MPITTPFFLGKYFAEILLFFFLLGGFTVAD